MYLLHAMKEIRVVGCIKDIHRQTKDWRINIEEYSNSETSRDQDENITWSTEGRESKNQNSAALRLNAALS